MSPVRLADLVGWFDETLAAQSFRDYGPNGLQVVGADQVTHVATAVSISLDVIERAAADNAQVLLVHHGLFWDGADARIGPLERRRLEALFAANLSLVAYHLPLDAHPEFGNNAQFGRRFGWLADARFGEQDLGFIGSLLQPITLSALAEQIELKLGRAPVMVPGDGRSLRRMAWCTGGAQSYFEAAIASGADAFVTGEISEPQAHIARETGVTFVACGHHASERFGAPALGEHLAQRFGLEHRFIDVDNPA